MSALDCGRPFVLGVPNQKSDFCGIGSACDPILRDYVSALMPFTYSTGAFPWGFTAAGILNTTAPGVAADGGNLFMPAGTNITLFSAGVTEALASEGCWWIATYSDCDLIKGGVRTERGMQFYITGLALSVMDSFQRGGTQGVLAATDAKVNSNWLHSDTRYQLALGRAILNNASLQMSFGSSPISYQFGLAAHHPEFGGNSAVRNGSTQVPGLYLPLNAGVVIGARDEIRKMILTLTVGQGVVIENDAVNPTVQSLYNSFVVSAVTGFVFTPVRVVGVGYIVAVPDAGGFMAAVSVDELATAVKSRLQQPG